MAAEAYRSASVVAEAARITAAAALRDSETQLDIAILDRDGRLIGRSPR